MGLFCDFLILPPPGVLGNLKLKNVALFAGQRNQVICRSEESNWSRKSRSPRQRRTEQRAGNVTSYPAKRIRATRGAFKAPGPPPIPFPCLPAPCSPASEFEKNGWLACRLRIRRSATCQDADFRRWCPRNTIPAWS